MNSPTSSAITLSHFVQRTRDGKTCISLCISLKQAITFKVTTHTNTHTHCRIVFSSPRQDADLPNC